MIGSFTGKYKGFSNFEPVVIYYKHYTFPSVEHAYQASKELYPGYYFYKILAVPAGEANIARKLGRKSKLRPDWGKFKLKSMEKFLRQKFEYKKFKNLLISTGDETLVEGNWWHDNFWGDCHCKKCKDIEGQNHLGKILMRLREEYNTNRERNNNRRHPRGIWTSQ